MHRSRLAGFVIDCKDANIDQASRFWSEALGMKAQPRDNELFQALDAGDRDLHIEVQTVEHESRVHLDIETDDVEAEAARLEALGATKIQRFRSWWVMQSPTGQRFCIVPAKDLTGARGVSTWGA